MEGLGPLHPQRTPLFGDSLTTGLREKLDHRDEFAVAPR